MEKLSLEVPSPQQGAVSEGCREGGCCDFEDDEFCKVVLRNHSKNTVFITIVVLTTITFYVNKWLQYTS